MKPYKLAVIIITCSTFTTYASTHLPETEGIHLTKYDGMLKAEGIPYMQQLTTAQFVLQAGEISKSQLLINELAAKRGLNQAVKSLAATALKDHNKANRELIKLAKSKNIALPSVNISNLTAGKPDSTGRNHSPKHAENSTQLAVDGQADMLQINQKMNKLIQSPGKEFDKQYLLIMIEEDKKAIRLFEKGTQLGDNDVKTYAAKYLTTLKKHLQEATALSHKIGDVSAKH